MTSLAHQVYARAVAAGMEPHAAESFAQAVAHRTGIAPPVVESWQQAEGGPPDNPLNIGPGKHFADPVEATVDFLTTGDRAGFYKGILGAGTPAGEIAAIKASPWDAGHYGNGVLDRTAAEHGITGIPSSGPTASPATSGGGGGVSASTRGLLANTLIGNMHAHGGQLDLLGLAGALKQLRSEAENVTAPASAAPGPSAASSKTSAAGSLARVPDTIATRDGLEVDSSILPSVQKIAGTFNVKVNSGYRSSEHNAAVGGAENSDHLRGDAVDFTGSVADMKALYTWAQGRFPYVEPWDQAKGNHVHISFRR